MNKFMSVYKKIVDSLYMLADCFGRISLVFMIVIAFSQVVLRGFFSANISWGEEVLLLVMVWMSFASMAIGVKEENHIRIEFFMARFPKVARKWIDFADNFVLLLVNIAMVYFGIKLCQFTSVSSLPVTGLPTSAIFAMIPISGILSCLALIGKLFGLYFTRGTENFINGISEIQSLKEEN